MRPHLSPRSGVAWHFFNLGMLTGNYVTRIPSVKVEHGLTDGMLGLVLCCISVGSMLSLPIVPLWNQKYGTGECMLWSAVLTALLLPLIGVNGHVSILILGMLFLGFGAGIIDVSMNTHAVAVEGDTGLAQMGLFHAMYAVGQLFGALVGGCFAELGLSALVNLASLSALSIAVSLWSKRRHVLYNKLQEQQIAASQAAMVEEEVVSGSRFYRLRSNPTFVCLCVIGFLAYMGEGAVEDWITVFFTEALGAKPLATSTAFAMYSLTVAGGRLLSDHLVKHCGQVRLLQLAGVVSCGGLLLVVMSPMLPASVYIATAALTLTGAGLSLTSPIIASAAGRVRGIPPAESISVLTSFTYTGYFVGPPLFGGVAELAGGVRGALFFDALLLLVIALLAKDVPQETHTKHIL